MAQSEAYPQTFQRGIALVLVLWILSLLTIMAGSFALSMRREAAIVAGEKDNTQALAIAESGVAIAELMLLDTNPLQKWRTDGSVYEVAYPNTNTANNENLGKDEWKIRIRLLSENGKVDINAADETILASLFKNAPVTPEEQASLIGALLDWRDSDDLVHLDGAEKEDYAKAGLHYVPSNKPFKAIEELQWLKGMDNTIYEWLEPLVTIYSGSPQVDFQKAAPEVLQAVANLDSSLIDDYVEARIDGARNDLPTPAFPASSGIATQNPSQKTEAVTILAEALLDDGSPATDGGKQGASISVVVQQANGGANPPFMVLKWRHNTTEHVSLFSEVMDDFLVKQYAEYKFNN